MNIAYLMNYYPMTSTTFIRREILALERHNVRVMRIALRGWEGELADPQDERERERSRYVLRDGPISMLGAMLLILTTRPMRFARALVLAWRMSRGADRPLFVHLVYLVEACRIAQWLQVADVRHVHAHFGTNSAEVAMLLHELGGPPWSFTVHGPEEFDKAPLIGLAEKIRHAIFVVAISSYGRSQLYRITPPEQWSKVKVVPCGLEPAYHAELPRTRGDSRRLVCVGRLCEQKGQLLLLEAARILAEQGADFELILAGDGEMRGRIEAQIGRYGLEARVRITGWISSDAVREELLASRALVLPSFAEGLPVVIMEAMALRRPVISTFVAGIPELVRSGDDGWLVPAGDVKALAKAMQECLDSDVDVLARMGETAQARVLERHDVDKSVGTLIAEMER